MAFKGSSRIPLGDSEHGGALFTLPREIRDEIYRLLVKGRHCVFLPSEPVHGDTLTDGIDKFDKHDLVILRTSKAISREAHEILYSESIFRYGINFWASKALEPPIRAVYRMQKMKM
ncbi:hypothetical protein HO173_011546 [Letharia columbiana]|uniref:Uncharacterized protein n=1 Tax=Letharia columbiana TaxID=112416 RepID=A0A8H6FJ65_9LECA|nr:uncharacterized protein HO173_011546 [Letharia columbiana]KAF6229506.1 hypothetical protein HO173_011546 [Letharia columbiana]